MNNLEWPGIGPGGTQSIALTGLDYDGGAIAQNFRRAHHGTRVVSNSDDGIGTHSSGVRQHQLKGLLSGGLTQIGEDPGPAAKQSPQPTNDAHGQRSRPDRDATHHPERLRHAKPWKFERRGCLHAANDTPAPGTPRNATGVLRKHGLLT
jgi:hypothetical protein